MKKFFFLICLIIIIIYYLFKNVIENFQNYKQVTITPTIPVYNKKIISSLEKNSMYYNFCNILSKIYPLIHIKGLGPYDNIKKLLNGKIDFTIIQEYILLDSILRKSRFKHKYNNIRIITPLYKEKICLIVNPNSKIKSWQDLRGKKVCFGKNDSGSKYIAIEMLKLINININDICIYNNSSYHYKTIAKLLNNQLDAICVVTSHPDKLLKKIFSIKLLSIIGTKGIPDNIFKARFPTSQSSNINLVDYNFPSLNRQIKTFSFNCILITLNTQNFKTIYNLINTIFSNTLYIRNNIKYEENKKVLEEFPVSSYFPKNNIIKLHDAVIKYYSDIGMITYNKNKKCLLFAGTGNCNLEIINYYSGY